MATINDMVLLPIPKPVMITTVKPYYGFLSWRKLFWFIPAVRKYVTVWESKVEVVLTNIDADGKPIDVRYKPVYAAVDFNTL
jgi:hypothetical protein